MQQLAAKNVKLKNSPKFYIQETENVSKKKKVDDLLARMRRNEGTITWQTILAPTREFLNLISGYGFQACYSHPNPRNWLLITLIEICIADNLMKYGSGWIMHWCHLQDNDCALQHLCWLCPSGQKHCDAPVSGPKFGVPTIQGSCGVHYRNLWGITQGSTWASPYQFQFFNNFQELCQILNLF